MPLNEIPKHIGPQTRSLIEAALEDAWQELNKDGDLETTPAIENDHRCTRLCW